MNTLQRITLLATIDDYVTLATGHTPSEEDDYDDFVEAIDEIFCYVKTPGTHSNSL